MRSMRRVRKMQELATIHAGLRGVQDEEECKIKRNAGLRGMQD